MSERPPREPDDLSLGGLVDEVVSQVRVALDEADIAGAQSRELLLDGVRDVMQALYPSSVSRSPSGPTPGAPDVSVVDGGRAEDAPPSPGERPDLRVAAPEADPAAESRAAETDGTQDQPRVFTRVKVHKTQPKPVPDRQPRVQLRGTDAEAPQWRSVFRGAIPRAYRLTAETGVVRVSLDGMPADEVPAGSSLDVEAQVIQVCTQDPVATLRYERLPC
jgi:hypothetical protein